jgi:hypothetical protein
VKEHTSFSILYAAPPPPALWGLQGGGGGQYRRLSHYGIFSALACAKLRKATNSFVMSDYLRPSAWNNSAPTRRIFMKFGI